MVYQFQSKDILIDANNWRLADNTLANYILSSSLKNQNLTVYYKIKHGNCVFVNKCLEYLEIRMEVVFLS